MAIFGATVTSQKQSVRWATRVIPLVLLGAFGYATYGVVVHLCLHYLMAKRQRGIAVALIVLYFIFFILTTVCYLRTFLTVKYNPGLVPLPPRPNSDLVNEKDSYGGVPDENPDSPGLEQFYSRDVFVCESDGRPKWCHECRNWKPDRAHHSSELGRCVYKMDHFCPWVGGMVAETSFKYFTQFVMYASCYLAICLATAVYCLVQQKQASEPLDPHAVVLVALSAFFDAFTVIMSASTLRLVFENLTNIDVLQDDRVLQFAIRIPLDAPTSYNFATVTYPLPRYPGQEFLPPTPHTNGTGTGPMPEPVTDRDRLAQHKFAIVRTEAGDNPWDLGLRKNWQTVMGTSLADYLLPIRPPPCASHDDMHSLYPTGRVFAEVIKRHNIRTRALSAK